MHPWRRQILYRWVLAAVAILGLGGYVAYTSMQGPTPFYADEAPEVEPVKLPTAADLSALEQAVRVVADLSQREPGPVRVAAPGLLDAQSVQLAQGQAEEVVEEVEPAPPELGMIFLGDASRFASLDGQMYSPGQTTEQGALVREIDWGKVNLVSSRGREQTLYWVDPGRVVLTRPTAEPGEGEGEGESMAAETQAAPPAGPETGRQDEKAMGGDPQVQDAMPGTIREAARDLAQQAGEQQRTKIEEGQ